MTLLSLAQQHQNAILRREAAGAAEITAAWKATWAQIVARLAWLDAQMEQAKASGRDINIGWLMESQRWQTALDSISASMHTFSQQAQGHVGAQINLAHQAGQQDAHLLIQHAAGSIKGVFGVPSPIAHVALVQRLHTGPIARRFAKMPHDAVRRARGTLLYGFAQGWGPRQVARMLRDQMGIELRDALRISRTELMQSYRDAALSTYQANSDVVKSWTWLAEPDACPFCTDMNGTVHDLGESLDSHPNCRCTMLPNTVSYQDILAA